MLGHSPDLVLAFPGGRGTADMVSRARKAGVRVVEIATLRAKIIETATDIDAALTRIRAAKGGE